MESKYKEKQEYDLINGEFKNGSKDDTYRKKSSIKEKIVGMFKKISGSIEDAWNSYIHISGRNLIYPILFFVGTIIYLEVILHLLIYRSIDMKIIYPVLFAMPLGILMGFITGLFKAFINKILLWVLTVSTCIIFNTQLVYFYVFKVFFSFQSIGMAGDTVSEFGSDILAAIKANIGGMLLLFLPLILLLFKTFLPALVVILLRNPWTRLLLRFFG
jgi:hypothetical protein